MAINPAVAILSFIINAYKPQWVLTAPNANVAWTSVDVTYFRFTKSEKTYTCDLLSPQTHLRMANKNRNICMPLFCRGQKLNFMERDPGHHKTMKYKIFVFVLCTNKLLVYV